MKKIGFIGFGKIGRAIYTEMQEGALGEAAFIQDISFSEDILEKERCIQEYDEELYRQADLIVECATADVLKKNIAPVLKHSDLMLFSVTAFSDEEFEKTAFSLAKEYGHHIYLPHGAILGLDGIMDGAGAWESVRIVTTKNPASLGRQDKERTVLYEGSARGACRAYPRNVNVHAAVALTGIGFDRTQSQIIADPSVHTNAHVITLKGTGIEIQMNVVSFSEGGVTGVYTPLSARGSFRRILGGSSLKIV